MRWRMRPSKMSSMRKVTTSTRIHPTNGIGRRESNEIHPTPSSPVSTLSTEIRGEHWGSSHILKKSSPLVFPSGPNTFSRILSDFLPLLKKGSRVRNVFFWIFFRENKGPLAFLSTLWGKWWSHIIPYFHLSFKISMTVGTVPFCNIRCARSRSPSQHHLLILSCLHYRGDSPHLFRLLSSFSFATTPLRHKSHKMSPPAPQ